MADLSLLSLSLLALLPVLVCPYRVCDGNRFDGNQSILVLASAALAVALTFALNCAYTPRPCAEPFMLGREVQHYDPEGRRYRLFPTILSTLDVIPDPEGAMKLSSLGEGRALLTYGERGFETIVKPVQLSNTKHITERIYDPVVPILLPYAFAKGDIITFVPDSNKKKVKSLLWNRKFEVDVVNGNDAVVSNKEYTVIYADSKDVKLDVWGADVKFNQQLVSQPMYAVLANAAESGHLLASLKPNESKLVVKFPQAHPDFEGIDMQGVPDAALEEDAKAEAEAVLVAKATCAPAAPTAAAGPTATELLEKAAEVFKKGPQSHSTVCALKEQVAEKKTKVMLCDGREVYIAGAKPQFFPAVDLVFHRHTEDGLVVLKDVNKDVADDASTFPFRDVLHPEVRRCKRAVPFFYAQPNMFSGVICTGVTTVLIASAIAVVALLLQSVVTDLLQTPSSHPSVLVRSILTKPPPEEVRDRYDEASDDDNIY